MESQHKQKELHKESILNQVKEIRASSDGVGCPYCGQPVKKSWEWCPSCGIRLWTGAHSAELTFHVERMNVRNAG